MVDTEPLIYLLFGAGLTAIGWFLKQMYDAITDQLLPAMDRIQYVLYGDPENDHDGGFIEDVHEIQESLDEESRQRRTEHEAVREKVERVDEKVSQLRANQCELVDELESDRSINVDIGDFRSNNGRD